MSARWLVKLVLRAYPSSIRREHGGELAAAIEAAWADRTSVVGRVRLASRLVADATMSWLRFRRDRNPRSGFRQQEGRPSPAPDLLGDLRSAFRLFTRVPLFAFGAAVTLALGIGATSAIFSLVDATVLRPLPIHDPDRVWNLSEPWSYPDFRDLESASTPFSDVAAWTNQTFGVTWSGASLETEGVVVSGGYFALTGLRPIAGRLLEPSDDRAEALTAVLSERGWTRIFRRDPSVLGSTIQVNDRPVVIVGVVPQAFRGLSLSDAPVIFLPLESLRVLGTGFLARPQTLTDRNLQWLHVTGRLRGGATAAEATSVVDTLYRRVHPPNAGQAPEPITMAPLSQDALGGRGDETRRFVFVLFGTTLVTLLLACATVANLLLVRAQRRRQEIALRTALGAGRVRLMRLILVESGVIGITGSLGGLAVAVTAFHLLKSFELPGQIAIGDLGLRLSPTLLAFSIALGLATSVVFGLAPALQAVRLDPQQALREAGRGVSRQRIRQTLVTAQVGLCVLLLLGSIAFGRAMQYALTLDLGFDTTHTAIVSVDPSRARYTRERILDSDRRIQDALQAEPWASAAAWMTMLPLHGSMSWEFGLPVSRSRVEIESNVVSDGYFSAMGIPLRAGRAFSPDDTFSSPPVIVVSDSVAHRYWTGTGAIGAQVSTDPDSSDPHTIATVIGIVGDVRRGIVARPAAMVYLKTTQYPSMLDFGEVLVIRTRVAPAVGAAQAVAVLRRVDPALPISRSQTMAEHLGALLMPQRLGLLLLVLFSTLAVVLTVFGIYAVVAFAVSERVREIGIRMALGAERPQVLRLVIRQGLTPVSIGVAIGMTFFAVAGSLVRSLTFALPSMAMSSIVWLGAAVGGIAIGAMLVPARRALAIDPAVALRQD